MGRDPRLCQLVFPAECDEVGRQHALLRFDPQIGQFLLEDCPDPFQSTAISGMTTVVVAPQSDSDVPE